MNLRSAGIVESILTERSDAQEVQVRVPAESGSASSILRTAWSFPVLCGSVSPGDLVLLNTAAVELGLGTGGRDFVVAVLSRPLLESDPAGHLLKLRYTPCQSPILAVEAPESPHHEAISRFESLGGTPVVCMELHSQLPAVCASAAREFQNRGFSVVPRIVYVMTDGAALPLALSRLVPELRARGLLSASITAGQSFGGDYEAINLYSALAAASVVGQADLIVVGQGPGNAGTGTPLGFSGIDQGLAVNAAASLGGLPILVPRISFADTRARHVGLSHHTRTILRQVVRAPALLPLPRLPRLQMRAILEALSGCAAGETIILDAAEGLRALESTGLAVTTMGRGPDRERPFFLAAAAAGILAARRAATPLRQGFL